MTVDYEALGKLAYNTWHDWWFKYQRDRGSRMQDDRHPWDKYRADDPIRQAEMEVARALVTELKVEQMQAVVAAAGVSDRHLPAHRLWRPHEIALHDALKALDHLPLPTEGK